MKKLFNFILAVFLFSLISCNASNEKGVLILNLSDAKRAAENLSDSDFSYEITIYNIKDEIFVEKTSNVTSDKNLTYNLDAGNYAVSVEAKSDKAVFNYSDSKEITVEPLDIIVLDFNLTKESGSYTIIPYFQKLPASSNEEKSYETISDEEGNLISFEIENVPLGKITDIKAEDINRDSRTYNFMGFTCSNVENVIINAEGTSEVKLYFDRKEITYIFESGSEGYFKSLTTGEDKIIKAEVKGLYGAEVKNIPEPFSETGKLFGWNLSNSTEDYFVIWDEIEEKWLYGDEVFTFGSVALDIEEPVFIAQYDSYNDSSVTIGDLRFTLNVEVQKAENGSIGLAGDTISGSEEEEEIYSYSTADLPNSIKLSVQPLNENSEYGEESEITYTWYINGEQQINQADGTSYVINMNTDTAIEIGTNIVLVEAKYCDLKQTASFSFVITTK